LSERNCIEIVQCLVELKLLEVIHTTDGKEYLTPNELAKEIREELTVRGGMRDHCIAESLEQCTLYRSAKIVMLIVNNMVYHCINSSSSMLT